MEGPSLYFFFAFPRSHGVSICRPIPFNMLTNIFVECPKQHESFSPSKSQRMKGVGGGGVKLSFQAPLLKGH